jgi:hypothetical protein
MVTNYIRPGMGQLANKDLGNFVVQINAFTDKARGNIDKVVRKIVFEVFKRIVKRTPCDTGRARAGWQVSSMYNASSGLGGAPSTSSTKTKTSYKYTKPYKVVRMANGRFVRIPLIGGGTSLSATTKTTTTTQIRTTTSISERGVGAFIGAKVVAGAGTFDKSGGSTINTGKDFILSEMKTSNGVIAYIYNNVRYIVFLEGGRVYPSKPYGSPQAPHGMVRITLAEYGGIVNQAVNEVKVGGSVISV